MSMFIEFLIAGLAMGSIYSLLGLGLSLLRSTTHLINFTQGSFAMITGLIMFSFYVKLKLPFIVAAIAALLIMAGFGVVFERIAIRRAVQQKITIVGGITLTVALCFFFQGAAPLLWGSVPHGVPSPLEGIVVSVLGYRIMADYFLILVVSTIVSITFWLIFERTMLGLCIKAMAMNSMGATLMGVNTTRIVIMVTVISVLLAAVAGIIVVPITVADINLGLSLLFKAFVGAMLAGWASHFSVFLGCLLIGVMESLVIGYITGPYVNTVIFGILFVVLLVKPAGLFQREVAIYGE